jgi:hypothetical protein
MMMTEPESHHQRTARLAAIAEKILEGHEKASDFDAANPWAQDAFDPYRAPQHLKKRRDPSRVPDTRMLYDIQKDLLKAIEALKSNEDDEEKLRKTQRQVENAYKLMVRYLKQYVTLRDEDKKGPFNEGV